MFLLSNNKTAAAVWASARPAARPLYGAVRRTTAAPDFRGPAPEARRPAVQPTRALLAEIPRDTPARGATCRPTMTTQATSRSGSEASAASSSIRGRTASCVPRTLMPSNLRRACSSSEGLAHRQSGGAGGDGRPAESGPGAAAARRRSRPGGGRPPRRPGPAPPHCIWGLPRNPTGQRGAQLQNGPHPGGHPQAPSPWIRTGP